MYTADNLATAELPEGIFSSLSVDGAVRKIAEVSGLEYTDLCTVQDNATRWQVLACGYIIGTIDYAA